MARKPKPLATPTPLLAPDPADLVTRMQRGGLETDALLMAEGFHTVFGSELGKLVLGQIFRLARLGEKRCSPEGALMSDRESAFTDGQQDLAIEIASYAGYGPAAISVATITRALEGQDHAPGSGPTG